MEGKFWIDAWEEGRTGFHAPEYQGKLLKFFPELGAKTGQKVLVPLCGKTRDLLWLAEQDLNVHGVELSEKAVSEFFVENHFEAKVSEDPRFKNFSHKNIKISCGDFFKLTDQDYDFIYDRAALVALPPEMRKNYAQKISQMIKPGGKYLLLSFEYDQAEMTGPPFSVTEKEVQELYGKHFRIRLVDTSIPKNESPRLSTVTTLFNKTYILEKL